VKVLAVSFGRKADLVGAFLRQASSLDPLARQNAGPLAMWIGDGLMASVCALPVVRITGFFRDLGSSYLADPAALVLRPASKGSARSFQE